MARYQHLPIFQAAYDFNLEIHKRTEIFPRVHRYSIGEKLRIMSLDLIARVVRANSTHDKLPILKDMEILLETLKIYIRTCLDLKIIGKNSFEFLVRKMEEIGQQLSGWKEWASGR